MTTAAGATGPDGATQEGHPTDGSGTTGSGIATHAGAATDADAARSARVATPAGDSTSAEATSPVPEVGLDFPRTWVELPDPGSPDVFVKADLTFLTSRWSCIFGSGCHGIDRAMPDAGCCTLGAHFADEEDRRRVGRVARRLTAADWQLREEGRRNGWLEHDGEEARTRLVDGACVFLNRPGFSAGAGCALHGHALRTGQQPLQTKPDVCWQLPLRRSYRDVERPDGSTYLEVTLTEYDRRGWGSGGHDLDWYCSGSPEAHRGPRRVYESLRTEIEALLGQPAYEALAEHCRQHVLVGMGRHPASTANQPLPGAGRR